MLEEFHLKEPCVAAGKEIKAVDALSRLDMTDNNDDVKWEPLHHH